MIKPRILIYGIGNPGRQDDGLGIHFIEALRNQSRKDELNFESNYQLNVEDALLISEFDCVVFVDATMEKDAQSPFAWRPITPSAMLTFTTHAMSPGTVVALCDELYGVKPKTFLLTIPGSGWEVSTELTPIAQSNLAQAIAAFPRELLRSCNNA